MAALQHIDPTMYLLLEQHGCVGEDNTPVCRHVLQAPKVFQPVHSIARIDIEFVSIGEKNQSQTILGLFANIGRYSVLHSIVIGYQSSRGIGSVGRARA